jgi:hypothetical protein
MEETPRSPDHVSKLRRYVSSVNRQTDYERWKDPESFPVTWEERSRIIAGMIAPGSSVLEFGAGSLRLPSYLPAGCAYTPSDLVARSPNTLVCDLNARPLPEFASYDVVVFSGVLEYLTDCGEVVRHAGRFCQQMIASYAVLREPVSTVRFGRRTNGWLNDFTEDELYSLFAQAGRKPAQTVEWESQLIVRFVHGQPDNDVSTAC